MNQLARSGPERKADTLAKLAMIGADTWVATASPSGRAHLVPLSYAWHHDRVILAVVATSVTVRNIGASGRARLGFGPTRDVVIVDALLDRVVDVGGAPDDLAVGYARQADWDPREESEAYAFVVLRPHHIQAWREANELAGRTVMRDGEWLV